jgi:hypothetical protein
MDACCAGPDNGWTIDRAGLSSGPGGYRYAFLSPLSLSLIDAVGGKVRAGVGTLWASATAVARWRVAVA